MSIKSILVCICENVYDWIYFSDGVIKLYMVGSGGMTSHNYQEIEGNGKNVWLNFSECTNAKVKRQRVDTWGQCCWLKDFDDLKYA